MLLTDFNQSAPSDAITALEHCCTATRWAKLLVERRPFASLDALHQAAEAAWSEMQEADWLEAFAGHPKIGDVSSLRAKYAHTHQLASGEQASVQHADEAVLRRLAEGNNAYEDKFGFIFIVCATGKSAAEMLALLEARLPNSRAQELANAAKEQGKILHIRIDKRFSV